MCAVRDILSDRFHAGRGEFIAVIGRGDGDLGQAVHFLRETPVLFAHFVGCRRSYGLRRTPYGPWLW